MVDSMPGSQTIRVVDLFCGAGGLAYGLRSAGLEIAAGVDLDPACRHPFEANCGGRFVLQSVATLGIQALSEWYGECDVRVLAGCAPCQPFSKYSQSRKSPDERWTLLRSFLRLAKDLLPEIVTMENVVGLSARPIWPEFVNGLIDSGYKVDWAEVNCSDYGVPQSRRRLVLLASRLGRIELPEPTRPCEPMTVSQAIGGLPRLDAGQSCPSDSLHAACRLSPLNLRRIRSGGRKPPTHLSARLSEAIGHDQRMGGGTQDPTSVRVWLAGHAQ